MILLTTLLLVAQAAAPPPDTLAARIPTDSYFDVDAEALIQRIRSRQNAAGEELAEYRTIATRRISVGIQGLWRERLLYSSELAARVHWKRDGVGSVEVLGAREVTPVINDQIGTLGALGVEDLVSSPISLAFDPSQPYQLQPNALPNFRHPLAEGSERDYRFRTGDTTSIRLADGWTVRLVELEVLPRRTSPELVAGSLWIDLETEAPVRSVFRFASPLRLHMRVGGGEASVNTGPSSGFRVPTPEVSAELRFMTVEYGLWKDRFWLPRLTAFEGTGRIGNRLEVPVRFEQSYSDYELAVLGFTLAAAAPLVEADASRADGGVVESERCRDGVCQKFKVLIPSDSVLHSREHLPSSPHMAGAALMTQGELEAVAELFGVSRALAGAGQLPRFGYSHPGRGRIRFNRVEGLALGAMGFIDIGTTVVRGDVWLGISSLDPSGALSLQRRRFNTTDHLTLYHRLDAMGERLNPFGVASTISSLLLGRDDLDYVRVSGVEIGGAPVAGGIQYQWRVFGERQRAVQKSTDFSVRRLLDREHHLPDVRQADAADQIGASATVRITRGLNPARARWGGEVGVLASTGDFRFGHGGASLWLSIPLPGVLAAFEVAGGTSTGELPLQSSWVIGGASTVRGYGHADRVIGEASWRARAELGTRGPAARAILFSDAGWAGPRGAVEVDPRLLSAGVGASFLDGLVRADLSRALRGSREWRFDLYLDGLF